MYARRTVIACIGYGCLVGGILAGTSTLAHAQDYPPYYSQAERVHIASTYARQQSISSGTAVVPVNTRARWTSPDGSITRYRTSTINVPKSTLRIGALSAMSRGIMHPGWQAAILAAGFIYSNSQIYIEGESSPSDQLRDGFVDHTNGGDPSTIYCSSDYSRCYNTPLEACLSRIGSNYLFRIEESQASIGCRWHQFPSSTWTNSTHYFKSPVGAYPIISYDPYEPTIEPATPEEIESIDPHIPPSLYDELWNGEPIPEWQDTITVLGSPATGVSADGALAPELADAVGRWGENMDAQYNGDEAPHTDHPTTGNTAQDQAAEEMLDGDIPPFPDLDVDWQIEELELPAFDSGIGPGQCPAPVEIPFPVGAGSFGWSYDPACELAETIRPGFIGMCAFIALLIVLRARGGE